MPSITIELCKDVSIPILVVALVHESIASTIGRSPEANSLCLTLKPVAANANHGDQVEGVLTIPKVNWHISTFTVDLTDNEKADALAVLSKVENCVKHIFFLAHIFGSGRFAQARSKASDAFGSILIGGIQLWQSRRKTKTQPQNAL